MRDGISPFVQRFQDRLPPIIPRGVRPDKVPEFEAEFAEVGSDVPWIRVPLFELTGGSAGDDRSEALGMKVASETLEL
jgi:hypothetical protein